MSIFLLFPISSLRNNSRKSSTSVIDQSSRNLWRVCKLRRKLNVYHKAKSIKWRWCVRDQPWLLGWTSVQACKIGHMQRPIDLAIIAANKVALLQQGLNHQRHQTKGKNMQSNKRLSKRLATQGGWRNTLKKHTYILAMDDQLYVCLQVYPSIQ